MELDKDGKPITPKKEEGSKPSPQESEAELEKRIKDNQSYATKARQGEIEAYRLLVETDSKAIEKIKDEKIKQKILEDKW
jgi:hypothetical protein